MVLAAASWATIRAMPGTGRHCLLRGWTAALDRSCRTKWAVSRERLRSFQIQLTQRPRTFSGPFFLNASCRAGLEDYALAVSAVHDHTQRFSELQVPDAALLFQRRLLGEPRPIDGTFAGVGIHGEVSDLEGGEVLEEMTALRRGDPEIVEAGFDDGAGAGDFVPLDGNTK